MRRYRRVRNSCNNDHDIGMIQVFVMTDPEFSILYPDDSGGDVHEMSQGQITVDVQQNKFVCQTLQCERVSRTRTQCSSASDDGIFITFPSSGSMINPTHGVDTDLYNKTSKISINRVWEKGRVPVWLGDAGLGFVIHELRGIGRDIPNEFLTLFFSHQSKGSCELYIFFKLLYVITSYDRSRDRLRKSKTEKRLHGFKPR